MIFSLAFIFNHASEGNSHASEGNSPCIGQLLSNAMTASVYADRKDKRQGSHT